jgi:Tfp pilus assembly protein PilN
MINLLPPNVKQDYTYALRNTVLSRWVVAFLVALVGVGAIGTYGWVVMNKSISTYQSQVASTQKQLNKENLKGVEAQVQDISDSFKLVVQVLSKEVLFSKLLQQIGTTIPKNAVLSDLTISQVQGAIDITAQAADYNTATQVQVNLADPKNQIFSKADILNIVCTSTTDATNSQYPCTVTIRALFGPNNQFLFINNKGA